MVEAARDNQLQIIWELAHFGYPDHISVWKAGFVDHFERYAREMARIIRDQGIQQAFFHARKPDLILVLGRRRRGLV